MNEMVEEDVSDSETREDAHEYMKIAYRTAMMNIYGSKLIWFETRKRYPAYKSITNTVNRLRKLQAV
ncbi:hypothetical protein ACF0H5_020745 [Mactra antiquata]